MVPPAAAVGDLPFFHLRPPPHLVALAEEELGETDAVRADALTTLTRTVAEQGAAGHTASARFLVGLAADPVFLLTFLRWAKFSIPAATARIAAFAAFVGTNAWATAADASTIRNVYEHGSLGFTPYRDRSGRRVLTLTAGTILDLVDRAGLGAMNRAGFWAFCALLRDPEVAIAGCVFVEDLAGAFDVRMIGVARSKENAFGWRMMQQVLPLRLQGILFTNPPPGVGVLWAIVARFLSPKLRKRVRMVGKHPSALAAFVEPTSLPVAFGGVADLAPDYSAEVALAGVRATPWMTLA